MILADHNYSEAEKVKKIYTGTSVLKSSQQNFFWIKLKLAADITVRFDVETDANNAGKCSRISKRNAFNKLNT